MKSEKSKNQIISDTSEESYDEEDTEITSKQFDKLLKKQKSYNIKKWGDLKINEIYIIINYRTVNTIYGESVVLTLENNNDVWCPGHLAKKIKDKEPPFFVRLLGLKPCTNNKKINITLMIYYIHKTFIKSNIIIIYFFYIIYFNFQAINPVNPIPRIINKYSLFF